MTPLDLSTQTARAHQRHAAQQAAALARIDRRLAEITRPPPPRDIVREMAVTMRETARDYDGCSDQDLARRGFSAAEIERHGDAARTLARRLTTAAERTVRGRR